MLLGVSFAPTNFWNLDTLCSGGYCFVAILYEKGGLKSKDIDAVEALSRSHLSIASILPFVKYPAGSSEGQLVAWRLTSYQCWWV